MKPQINDYFLLYLRSDGNGKQEKARPIRRKVNRVYGNGDIQDNAGEVWKLKRTSQGFVAVLLLAILFGCGTTAPNSSQGEVIIRTLTDNGCSIQDYSERERFKEVVVTCRK
jgi:hypothetical protein